MTRRTQYSAAAEAVTVRQLLRASTDTLHTRVDKRMTALLDHADGYRQFLLATAGGVLPLERELELAGVASILPDWGSRSRSSSLRSDLAALYLAEPVRYLKLQRSDEAYLYGVLYVLEGSRLGSKVLLRILEKASGAELKCATSYLSHGQVEPFWPTFLARLEASRPVKEDLKATIAGASAAFEVFLRQAALPGRCPVRVPTA